MFAVKAKSSHGPYDFKERHGRKGTEKGERSRGRPTPTHRKQQREAGAFKQDETGETGEVDSEEGREAIFKRKQNDISIEQRTGK